MKKALFVATIIEFFSSFEMNDIAILQNMGYEIHLASNEENITDANKVNRLFDMGVIHHNVSFARNPLSKTNLIAYKQLKKLMKSEHFDLIHCHTPVGGVLGRIAAKKYRRLGIKVIYTAHGFHFYDGAPIKNWLLYYPIEKLLSRYTDVLITINKEDYARVKVNFRAKKTAYIPGVGVDTEKFAPRASGREKIRTELGLKDSDILILSVGELNENKNHETVIRAAKGMKITYVIVGKGDKKDGLETAAKECGVDLRLTGYRNDVADFYDAADVYVLPSIKEGFNVRLMEAMASGLACVCGRTRGNTDLIEDERCLFDTVNQDEIRMAIDTATKNREELGRCNLERIKNFEISTVDNIVSEIYGEGYEHLINLLKRQEKRVEIGIPLNAMMMISVGELSVRKNHKVVVQALSELPDNYWYVIVGKGSLKDELEVMDYTGRLRFLGYRTDIVELLRSSDLFVFPSFQEGLPVALMEAMASGLPCVCSRIRGNTDLIDDENCLFEPVNISEMKNAINTAIENSEKLRRSNLEKIKCFDGSTVDDLACKIYQMEDIQRKVSVKRL